MNKQESHLSPTRQSLRIKFLRRLLALVCPLAATLFSLSSCGDQIPADAKVVHVIDAEPIGNGLKVIGYSLLAGTVVVVVGRLIK